MHHLAVWQNSVGHKVMCASSNKRINLVSNNLKFSRYYYLF